jgi:hypothetical protein
MVVRVRPFPSVMVSITSLIVDKMYPTGLPDFIECTDGTKTASYIRDGQLNYGTRGNINDAYRSEEIKLLNSAQANCLAACYQKVFEIDNPDSRLMSGLVMSRTSEVYRDVFCSLPDTFNWANFIRDGQYTHPDTGAIVAYKKAWFVKAGEALNNVPQEYEHVMTVMLGGHQNGIPSYDIRGSFTYGLFVTTRALYDDRANFRQSDWTNVDLNDRWILTLHSSSAVRDASVKEAIDYALDNTGSANSLPGNFVLYDPYTLFKFDPALYISSTPVKTTLSQQTQWYYDEPYLCHLPPAQDDSMSLKTSLTPTGPRTPMLWRMINGKNFRNAILAIRPAAMQSTDGNNEFLTTLNYHQQFNPEPFMARYEDGIPIDAIQSSLEELLDPTNIRYAHCLTMFNANSLVTFSQLEVNVRLDY